jgi:hypothetical protein
LTNPVGPSLRVLLPTVVAEKLYQMEVESFRHFTEDLVNLGGHLFRLLELASMYDTVKKFFILICAVGLWVLRPLQAYCTSPG